MRRYWKVLFRGLFLFVLFDRFDFNYDDGGHNKKMAVSESLSHRVLPINGIFISTTVLHLLLDNPRKFREGRPRIFEISGRKIGCTHLTFFPAN